MKRGISLSQQMARSLQRFISKERKELVVVINGWDKIVGKEFSKHIIPKSIKKSCLFVEVSSPAFSSQMTYKKLDFIAKLNKVVGYEKINNIKTSVKHNFVVSNEEENSVRVSREEAPREVNIPEGTDLELKNSLINFAKNIKT